MCQKLSLDYFRKRVENFAKFAKLRTRENFALYTMDKIFKNGICTKLKARRAATKQHSLRLINLAIISDTDVQTVQTYACVSSLVPSLETRLIFESKVSETPFVAVMPLSPVISVVNIFFIFSIYVSLYLFRLCSMGCQLL